MPWNELPDEVGNHLLTGSLDDDHGFVDDTAAPNMLALGGGSSHNIEKRFSGLAESISIGQASSDSVELLHDRRIRRRAWVVHVSNVLDDVVSFAGLGVEVSCAFAYAQMGDTVLRYDEGVVDGTHKEWTVVDSTACRVQILALLALLMQRLVPLELLGNFE